MQPTEGASSTCLTDRYNIDYMMNRILFLLIFLSFLHSASAQGKKYSLQQCIDSAIAHNVEVRRTALVTEAAAVNYSQAKSNLLPSLNASVTHGINKGRSIDPFTNSFVNQTISFANYGIGTGVTVFNGHNLRNSIRQYAFASDAAAMQLQQAKDELTLDVILAYLQVLNNEDLAALARQQVAVVQKQVERLQILDSRGAIAPSQLAELTGQMKESELAVLTLQNAVESSKLMLLQLMNQPYDSTVQLERAEVAGTLQAPADNAQIAYAKALEQLAAIKAAALNTKSAEYSVKASRGLLFPTVSLTASANTNYSSIATRSNLLNTTDVTSSDYVVVNGSQLPVMTQKEQYSIEKIRYGSQLDNNLFYNIGLTVRVPIFNSFVARNRVKLARIEFKNSLLLEEGVRTQVRQQVEQAYLNYVNAWKRLQVLREQAAFFEAAFRAAEVRFNAGVGTSIDYILARNNYDRANGNLVMARYEYLFRSEVIRFYTGAK
jgi:outer membrane protein